MDKLGQFTKSVDQKMEELGFRGICVFFDDKTQTATTSLKAVGNEDLIYSINQLTAEALKYIMEAQNNEKVKISK